MQRGERITLVFIVLFSAYLVFDRTWPLLKPKEPDPGIPFYSTADAALKTKAGKLIDQLHCKQCHDLWGRKMIAISVNSLMHQSMDVPAPRLEGIGSLRSEQWLYRYFSAKDPQKILPSRLKKEFQMPSYAGLPEDERRALAKYMSSLKVERWYLRQTKQAEYEVLTGKPYPKDDSGNAQAPK